MVCVLVNLSVRVHVGVRLCIHMCKQNGCKHVYVCTCVRLCTSVPVYKHWCVPACEWVSVCVHAHA